MNVGEMVHRPATCCRPDTPIENVADQMRRANVGAVIVVDEDDRLAGIATDRDVFIRGQMKNASPTTHVDAVMSSDVEFVYSTDDVFDAATRMATRGCRRLPVLDPSGAVKGMITLDDLLILFAAEFDKLARTVGRELGRSVDDAPITLRRGRTGAA